MTKYEDKSYRNENALEDMMSALPVDLPIPEHGGSNGELPERMEMAADIIGMMLGEDSDEHKLAKDVLSSTDGSTNFSNMSLESKDVEFIRKHYDRFRIKLSHDIPHPVAVIRLGGKTIATVSDMTTITGKAKARKSYFLSAVITAALNPTYYAGNLDVHLPDARNKIIWIDTEQSEFWSQEILRRVKRSGVPPEVVDERIIYLNCRDLSVNQLKAITYVSLDKYSSEASLCIIDGSRDLVTSVNSEDESTQLARWMPEMAKKYSINITNVLHQNPSGGEASKLRGHLGTELMNKSEFVVEIKQHPKDEEVYIASSMLSRDIGTDEACFIIEDGILQFTDTPVTDKDGKGQLMHAASIEELKDMTKAIFKMKNVLPQSNLKIIIQEQIKHSYNQYIGTQRIVSDWIPFLENKGLISLDTSKTSNNGKAKYYKKEAFADTNTENIAPF